VSRLDSAFEVVIEQQSKCTPLRKHYSLTEGVWMFGNNNGGT